MARFVRTFRVPSLLAVWVLAATLLLPLAGWGQTPEFRAAWADVFHVGMGSQAEVNTMVAKLVQGHYNAVIVQVLGYMDRDGSNSHGAHWKSNILPWSPRVTTSFDPLAYLCTQAHANGIEVHAWLGGSGGAMYRVSTVWPPANNATLANNPQWFMAPLASSEGGAQGAVDGMYILDMGSPDAQEYVVSIVKELVTNYPIDGINWDDEINGAGYTAGFGYPAFSQASYPRSGLARFRINTGYVGTPSNTDAAWSNYRRRFKNELMARVQAEIQSIKINPRQPLRHSSAALAYSSPPSNCDFTTSNPYLYFCDWAAMLQNGWVDAVIPQTYSSSTLTNWVNRIASCWQYNRMVFPGLGGYLTNNITIDGYITHTRSKGLKGNSIYSYAVPNKNDTDWYAYVAANLYTNVVTTPPMPWRNPATATEGIMWGRVQDANTGNYVDDATVAVSGGPTVKTDGNGYYVATLISATAAGTVHSTTASKTGMGAQTIANATVLAGDIVRYDFTLNAVAPSITTQPQSQSVYAGNNAPFSVSASGPQPLSYQWRFNATNLLAGATTSSYTRSNAQLADAGSYSVVVTNPYGRVTSAAAVLTVLPSNVPPSITAQPQDQTVFQGNTASLSVGATGSPTLAYQWRWYGTNLNGVSTSSLSLSTVATNQSGPYTVVVTNAYGAVTSQVAMVVVNSSFRPGGLALRWSLGPGSRTYLTTNSLPYERGLAYNPVTGHLLVVSRTTPDVYVLDAATGAEVNKLSVSGVSGGTYPLLMVDVAEDGVVYAGNLATTTPPTFTLYRWANDSASTTPTLAYSGDPGLGNTQRWGDTLTVRGAGANTQVLIGSRSGNLVALLSTANGTTFTAKPITVADAPTSSFGLGVAFDVGNTFWGKANGQLLRQVTYDFAAGTGSSTRVYGNTVILSTVSPIGVSTPLNLLGGINVGASNNHLRLYSLSPIATNGDPVLLGTCPFATDYDNTGTGAGAVDFSSDTVFALCPNNGIIAVQITPAPAAPGILSQPADQAANPGASATFTVLANGIPSPSYQWRLNGGNIAGATASTYTRANLQSTDAGNYSVVVSNLAGMVTSREALLTVNSAPSVPAPEPQDQTCNVGATVTFVVHATGSPAPAYQWKFNGVNLPGATGSSYSRANAQSADAGSYSVALTNALGWAVSRTALLTVNVPPGLTSQPQSVATNAGANVFFLATANGTPPLTYQWRFNGADIAGATDTTYSRLSVEPGDAGSYSVVASNVAGVVTSAPAMLTVVRPYIESIQWLSTQGFQLQIQGGPGRFAIEAAPDLTSWTALTNLSATEPVFPFLDTDLSQSNRFYRVKGLP